MPSRRIERINHLVRQELADLLAREVKDQTLSSALISITDVDTSPDLRSAKVYFSVYGDEEVIKQAETHLKRASGFLHNQLKDRLDLRYIPNLEFVLDRSLARGDRIMRLMRSIEEERGSPSETRSDAASVGRQLGPDSGLSVGRQPEPEVAPRSGNDSVGHAPPSSPE